MPIPQTVTRTFSDSAACQLVSRWGIQYGLASRLIVMAGQLPFGIQLISGKRSLDQQEQLARSGRPAADFNLSTHADRDENGCPRLASGADLRVSVAVVPAVKAQFGAAAVFAGLRWGGGSPVGGLGDAEPGIPSDWNHVDLGPRSEVP